MEKKEITCRDYYSYYCCGSIHKLFRRGAYTYNMLSDVREDDRLTPIAVISSCAIFQEVEPRA